jgi:hypothetical protein
MVINFNTEKEGISFLDKIIANVISFWNNLISMNLTFKIILTKDQELYNIMVIINLN